MSDSGHNPSIADQAEHFLANLPQPEQMPPEEREALLAAEQEISQSLAEHGLDLELRADQTIEEARHEAWANLSKANKYIDRLSTKTSELDEEERLNETLAHAAAAIHRQRFRLLTILDPLTEAVASARTDDLIDTQHFVADLSADTSLLPGYRESILDSLESLIGAERFSEVLTSEKTTALIEQAHTDEAMFARAEEEAVAQEELIAQTLSEEFGLVPSSDSYYFSLIGALGRASQQDVPPVLIEGEFRLIDRAAAELHIDEHTLDAMLKRLYIQRPATETDEY